MVMDPKTVDTIYRMSHEQKLSVRQISRQLHVSRKAIRKYLEKPIPIPVRRKQRSSKLDPFKPVIREFLDQCPTASSVVIAQRIRPLGYTGGKSILSEYLSIVRQIRQPERAYVRVESSPGDRFEIDWGHFDAIDYQGDKRKLYAFCCIECHSRRLYVEFTQPML
jgi:transposase